MGGCKGRRIGQRVKMSFDGVAMWAPADPTGEFRHLDGASGLCMSRGPVVGYRMSLDRRYDIGHVTASAQGSA